MSIFTRALKYSKSSCQVDVKIDLFNLELKKTKLGEAIANTTSGVYSITQDIPEKPYVPPTNTEVPDSSGITGNGFNQPTEGGIYNDPNTWDSGWNNNDYLKNPNEINGEPDRPIVATVPGSPYDNAGYGGIVTYSGYFGTSVGYITAGNQYRQILVGGLIGGTEDPTAPNARSPGAGGYYGGLTDAQHNYAMEFWRRYQSIVNVAGSRPLTVWNTYNRFHDFQRGGEYATWTGGPKKDDPQRGGMILTQVNLLVHPQTYESDPGSPYERGYTTLISRNGLGDSNYYPGPVQPQGDVANLGPYEVKTMLDIIRGTPGTPDAQRARDTLDRWATPGSKNRETLIRMGILEKASSDIGGNTQIAGSLSGTRNSAGDKPIDAKGPHSPIKDYGGNMRFGPSGPSRDPWSPTGLYKVPGA